jgi:hypothetical protein
MLDFDKETDRDTSTDGGSPGLVVCGVMGLSPIATPAPPAAKEVKPAVSEEASAALSRMGKALSAQQFSFQAKTIRVYTDAGVEPLHIFHTLKVTVRRPNRLLAEVSGDDGSNKIVFDGKTAVIFSARDNKYASIPVPEGTIEGVLKEAVGRLGVDFPLADFLSETADKVSDRRHLGSRCQHRGDRRRPLRSSVLFSAARHRSRIVDVEERAVLATTADRDLPDAAGNAQLYRGVFRLGLQYSSFRRRIHVSAAGRVSADRVEAGRGSGSGQEEGRQVMRQSAIIALSALMGVAAAPNAFAWGAYHGGYGGGAYHGAWGGGAYHGAWGGGAYHSGAFGTTGVHYGPSGATAYHSGAYGTSAYHTGAYGTTGYHSGAYGTSAYHYNGAYGGYHGAYHGGYYGGTTVVTPGYTGVGAAAAGAAAGVAVGAAATSAAYAAASTNYYPPPYYSPYP